jgi:Ca2+-binding EF-hand superfamily protein
VKPAPIDPGIALRPFDALSKMLLRRLPRNGLLRQGLARRNASLAPCIRTQTRLFCTDGKKMEREMSFDEGMELEEMIRLLPPDSRQEIKNMFIQADTNKDGVIEKKEFMRWCRGRHAHFAGSDMSGSFSGSFDLNATGQAEPVSLKPSGAQLLKVALRNAPPMLAFGFVDNFIMIMAGDFIDERLSLALGLSTMAAAGLGNAFSDVVGVGMGSSIEASSEKLGLPDPKLTRAQGDSFSAKAAHGASSALFIFIGCLLGMVPLWFLDTSNSSETALKKVFESIDVDESGQISAKELRMGIFMSTGIRVTEKQLYVIMSDFDKDKDGELSMEEFLKLSGRIEASIEKYTREEAEIAVKNSDRDSLLRPAPEA